MEYATFSPEDGLFLRRLEQVRCLGEARVQCPRAQLLASTLGSIGTARGEVGGSAHQRTANSLLGVGQTRLDRLEVLLAIDHILGQHVLLVGPGGDINN